jgi:hypothetical protein
MIVLLIVAVVCLPLIGWKMIANAQQKQLEAEAQLLIHQEFFNEAIRTSVLATDDLVGKIIDEIFDRIYPDPKPEIRTYLKHKVIEKIGHLRHVDPGYYRCLGTFNKDK